MAHFMHLTSPFRAVRRDCSLLLTLLMIGSLAGALLDKLQDPALSVPEHSVQSSWVSIWLRVSLFPCLLAVSFLLRRRAFCFLLFFLKGFAVSLTLCVFARCGAEQLVGILPTVLLSVLLLPVQFFLGLYWLQDDGQSGKGILLLAPMLLLSLLGALLQTYLVS